MDKAKDFRFCAIGVISASLITCLAVILFYPLTAFIGFLMGLYGFILVYDRLKSYREKTALLLFIIALVEGLSSLGLISYCWTGSNYLACQRNPFILSVVPSAMAIITWFGLKCSHGRI